MLKFRKLQCGLRKIDFIKQNKQKYLLKLQLQHLRLQSTIRAVTSPEEVRDSLSIFSQEWQRAKPYEEIPTLSRWALVRNVLPGGKYYNLDTCELLLALKQDLGGICKLPGLFGQSNLVLTHNVEDFETIYRNEGIWPTRQGFNAMHYHRSVHRKDFFQGVEGLLPTRHEKWGSFRSAVNPVVMQSKTVRLYMKKMSQVNKELIQRIIDIRDPKTLEVPDTFEEEINRWTLESVSVVAFDTQLGLFSGSRNNPLTKQMFDTLNEFITNSLDIEYKPSIWRYYKTKSFRKLMYNLDTILKITQLYVNEAVVRLEQERLSGKAERPENEKSVLEKLIKVDKKIAIVMASEMLMAGVDTSSSAFAGILLCIAKNPAKQQKLRKEIKQILPHKDSEFTEDSFKNMPYLRACIKESLRCYPITVGNARTPINDVVLSGYRVPKGTRITMVQLSLLKDEKHFPRANEYLPERWLRANNDHNVNNESSIGLHSLRSKCPFVYLPFGFGPRTCIGRRIVAMELELGLARIIRNFHIEFNYPSEKAFKSGQILVPNIPLRFKFTDLEN